MDGRERSEGAENAEMIVGNRIERNCELEQAGA
jgi:hypothetical protein